MLRLEAIHTSYGRKAVLHGVSLEVRAGEIVSLVGRNGMGKTTAMRSIMGLTPSHAGRIVLDGRDITREAPERISRLGIGYVPEGRGIFPTLTVRENLVMTARPGPWTLERVLARFPRLDERARNLGSQLSGGEQQMLAIGRALMLNPRLILLDEATEGLAPLIQDEIWRSLAEMRDEGLGVLVVDKDLDALAQLSDRFHVLEKGEVRWSGTPAELEAARSTVEQLIGLKHADGANGKVALPALAPVRVFPTEMETPRKSPPHLASGEMGEGESPFHVDQKNSGQRREQEAPMFAVDRSVVPARITLANEFNTSVAFVDRHIAEGRGDKVMARWRDRSLTYRGLAEGVERTAAGLRGLGIAPGDRVVLLVKDTEAFYFAFLGAVRIGAVAIPVNTFLRAADYAYMLEDSGAKAVFASAGTFGEIEPALASAKHSIAHRIACEGAREGWTTIEMLMESGASGDGRPYPTTPNSPCFWLYSSGSTGNPKASVHEHKDMLYTAEHFAAGTLGLKEDDVIFSAAKLFFAYGLGNALSFPLYVGATQVLLEDRPTAENTLDMISRFQPSLYFGVPTLYAAQVAALDRGHQASFAGLRIAASGGEPLPPAVLEGWQRHAGVPILDGIGSSEVLHIYCSNRLGDVVPGSCGRLVPGYELRVVGPDGKDMGVGEAGELWIRGDSVTKVYWNKPEKTESAMRQGGWFRSGDTVYRDENGNYFFCGRDDDMLKVGGIWVAPFEVESALAAHPAVLEAAVVGQPDDAGLVKPKAVVVLRDKAAGGPTLEAELREFVKARLAPFKYPRWIAFVDELPKTASGKIQRFRLRTSR